MESASLVRYMDGESMARRERISDAVVRRLPAYYRHLRELEQQGVTRMSSQSLGRRMNLTASQIRQDMNCFGGFGQQGYGYHIPTLRQHIGEILGLNFQHRVVVVGAGNMGRAIAHYASFRRDGFIIEALFDTDPALVGQTVSKAPVLDRSALGAYLDQNAVDILAVATPLVYAQATVNEALAHGVRAFWNFAPVDLRVPRGIIVQNVHLSESLMTLSYRIHEGTAQDEDLNPDHNRQEPDVDG